MSDLFQSQCLLPYIQAAALLGALRPVECVCLCEAACLRPRADPEDDSDWPPARSEQPAALPPVLVSFRPCAKNRGLGCANVFTGVGLLRRVCQ